MSESSERMLLLLRELAVLDAEELNSTDRQRRREEISREMQELAERKRRGDL